jgi:hypothetical protein
MFISKIKAAAGGDRSPWGDFWFQSVGLMSSSGIRVDADTAIQAEVQDEMREELGVQPKGKARKAAKPAPVDDPAAQPPSSPAAAAEPKAGSTKGTKKGRKLSAEEAQRGIADALQGQESSASSGAAEDQGGSDGSLASAADWPWPANKESRGAALAEE